MDEPTTMSMSMNMMSTVMMGHTTVSSMDMAGHSGHGAVAPEAGEFCGGDGRVMLNGFQTSVDGTCVLYLFQNAAVDTEGKYVVAVLFTVLLAALTELVRWYRGHIATRRFAHVASLSNTALDVAVCFLYATNMFGAYLLMLLVMLYEYVLLMAILLGLAVGLFVTRRLDRKYFPNLTANRGSVSSPCCNASANEYDVPHSAGAASSSGNNDKFIKLDDVKASSI